jgi:hypothetical protein
MEEIPMPTKKKTVTTETAAPAAITEVKKPRVRAAAATAATHKPAVRRTAKKEAAPAAPEAVVFHAEVEREAYLLWERTGADANSNWFAAEKAVLSRYSA